MVRVIYDTYIKDSTEREMHIRYDPTIANDKLVIEKLSQIILTEQPLCENCANYYLEGYFCGYRAHCCKIHGCLEGYDHPHRDGDGSKCSDYTKRIETAGEVSKQEAQIQLLRIQSEEERARLKPFEEKLKKLKEETK